MSVNDITQLIQGGVLQILLIAGPILGAALVIGLVVAIFQATTSIQEQTLTFLPKMLIMLLIIALLGGLMMGELGQYTKKIFDSIPKMAR